VKYGAFAKRLGGDVRWRLVYRNIDDPYFWARGVRRRFFYRHIVMPQVDGVVGVSRTTLARVRELYRIDVPSVYVPNGIGIERLCDAPTPTSARTSLGVPEGVRLVVFAGALTEQKRPDRFVRVLAEVRQTNPDAEGWIIGDGPLRAEVEALAAELGLSDHVRFCGSVPDVSVFFAAADVLAVTSDSDGIPAVVLEAGFLRVPVVATRVGGMHECVIDGETGRLLEPEDEHGLAEAIVQILDGDPRVQTMGERAREWILKEFTMERVARRYVDVYDQLRDQ
jgi:glycosyltransferase involved in cell wall biosynthesis